MKFDYEYTEIGGYDSQYKNEDFKFGVPVEAIYVKSKVSTDRGYRKISHRRRSNTV